MFSGSSIVELATEVSKKLGTPLSQIELKKFGDGELFIEIQESVRNRDVFVLQSTYNPVNVNYMQAFLMIDALKRASARKVNVVMPYFGYARQDRMWGRSPISASLLARFIEQAGADSFMSFELHIPSISGFFKIPVDNLTTTSLFADFFKNKQLPDLTVVSPDVGGAKRADKLARKLGAELAIIHKQRPAPNQSEVRAVVGEVQGRNCILADDIADTGGSLVAAARMLEQKGATNIFAAITHPVLSGDAVKKIEDSPISEMVVSDSIPLREKSTKIRVVSLAPMIAESIKRIHEGASISQVFDP